MTSQENPTEQISDKKDMIQGINKGFKRKTREEYFDELNSAINLRKVLYGTSDQDFTLFKKILDVETYRLLGKNIEDDFEEIKIKDLQINTIHSKNYLILKIISKIALVDSVNFIGEDSNNDVILVSIYDAKEYYQADWDKLENKIFTEGKYIIVVEPYYKMSTCCCCSDKLRVESVNETIILNNKENLDTFLEKIKLENKSYEDYAILGDLVKTNSISEQVIFYFEKSIIEQKKKNEKDFDVDDYLFLSKSFLYISMSYIQCKYATKAAINADNCLNTLNQLTKINDKEISDIIHEIKIQALLMKSKALIRLREYKEDYEIIFDKNDKIKDEDIIKDLLKIEHIKNGLIFITAGKDNNLGLFDFELMLTKEDEKNYYGFFGDYISPKLEIQFEKDKGLKIVAKENINKGELILVEKALAFKRDKENSIDISVPNLKEVPEKIDIDLYNDLAEKILNRPLDYEKFYFLYDGTNLNEDIDQRKEYLKNQIDGKIKLTKEKIINVIKNNLYQIGRNIIYYKSIGKGIWGYASLINNDCSPNTAYFGIGEYFISYCIKEIKKDEEITCRYNNSSLTLEDRQEYLLKNWGFECKCQLCESQKKYNNSEFNNFIKIFAQPNSKIEPKMVESFAKFLKENEKNLQNYDLANSYFQLEDYYNFKNDSINMQKYSDLLKKYLKEDYYFLNILHYNGIIINSMLSPDSSNLKDNLDDLENYLIKYSPLKKDDIKSLIIKNAKSFCEKFLDD